MSDYTKILPKMFIIESLGEVIYDKLYAKTANPEFKAIYKILAENELNTRKHIEQELLSYNLALPLLSNNIAVATANSLFYFIPGKMLDGILRKILKRRIYRKWHKQFNHENIELWDILLEHEKLQHKLLMISCK
jgi:hypothetical protein